MLHVLCKTRHAVTTASTHSASDANTSGDHANTSSYNGTRPFRFRTAAAIEVGFARSRSTRPEERYSFSYHSLITPRKCFPPLELYMIRHIYISTQNVRKTKKYLPKKFFGTSLTCIHVRQMKVEMVTNLFVNTQI